MDSTLPENVLQCTQCGGELHPEAGQTFLTCPYCSSTVYIDKSQVVFHWYLAPTLNETQSRAALAAWMAGNQTVKDLDKKSQVVGQSFEYFPIWYFKRLRPDGKEEILLEPAAATSVSELKQLKLPAGDLRKYDASVDPQARPPTVPLQAAMQWMAERQVPAGEVKERSLVHIPLYTFKYTYLRNTYTAVAEAGTGGIFANIYPAKAEAPYLAVGLLTAVIFLCLAAFPVIGASSSSNNGTWIGLLACAGLGIVAAPVLMGLAAWIASKI